MLKRELDGDQSAISKDIKDNTAKILKLLVHNLSNVHPKLAQTIRNVETNLNDVQLSDAMDYLVNTFTRLVT